MPLPSLPTLPTNGQQGPQALSTPAPLHPARWARNGLVPHAIGETELGNALNFCGNVRTKNLFTWCCPIDDIPSSGTTTTRWRFAARTGPMLSKIKAILYLARQDSADSPSPSATLTITNADASTTYGTATFEFGKSNGTVSDVPDSFSFGEVTVSGVPADSAIYGVLENSATGRLIAATVFEESLKIWKGNGYPVSQVAVTSPILDDRRGDLMTFADDLWKHGAAHLWNFSADNQASPRSTIGTSVNLIDNSSTAVSAATPGATLDLRYCKTRSASTVAAVFAAYGFTDSGTAGNVFLKKADGTTLATITGFSTTASWQSTTVDLPADLAKLDIHYGGDGVIGFNIGAASLYLYEA